MTKTIAEQVIPNKFKQGERTVTVTCVDGSTFEAPARGPVLYISYIPDDEAMDKILETNLARMDASPEETIITVDGVEHTAVELLEKYKAVEAIEKENLAYYNTLAPWWDKRVRKNGNEAHNTKKRARRGKKRDS